MSDAQSVVKKAADYIDKFFEDLPNMKGENGYGRPDSEDVIDYLRYVRKILEGRE